MANTGPLRQIIDDLIEEAVLDKIAIEHNKGRRLFIGTTNLDAERPVIWNIGAIAARGEPGALQLIRDVLQASAAIPGMCQPVYFKIGKAISMYLLCIPYLNTKKLHDVTIILYDFTAQVFSRKEKM
jgi:predicted acylesterase/phospholipase RssA